MTPKNCLFLSLFSSWTLFASASKCPQQTPDWKSESGGDRAYLKVENESPLPLAIYWVDYNGNDGGSGDSQVLPHLVYPGDSNVVETYTKHNFRIYGQTRHQRLLLHEHKVEQEQSHVLITGDCDEVQDVLKEEEVLDKERQKEVAIEMESLVHDQSAPCLPPGNSSQWSCIRHIDKQDYEDRLEKGIGTIYGFNSTKEAQHRDLKSIVDHSLDHVIDQIPRLTSGPGYLKMSFTDKMKEVLLPWYEEHKKGGSKDAELAHRVIPGGYTNSHTVQMSIISLDRFPEIHNVIVNELQRVLEWWTGGTKLAHTSTFGIRIYHRNSMLINHVDRPDTHLASAVIQVAQDVDEGWPLEVMHEDDGSCDEVFLQSGEMVLYEGARFRHGRPMRFNGTAFANIFSHFRPIDWHGPNKSPKYDGLLDEAGYMIQDGKQDEL